MKTKNQILKIKAVILYILKSFPEGVGYIKLFKLLYFAQQDHLVKYGKPIVDETFYALKHGPVPSFSYKVFQASEGKQEMSDDFSSFLEGMEIECKDNIVSISAKIEADLDELSISNIKCLDNSIDKNKDIDPYDLSELSHDKAWKSAYNRAKNDPEKNVITLIDIAKAGGAEESTIDYIKDQQLTKRFFL